MSLTSFIRKPNSAVLRNAIFLGLVTIGGSIFGFLRELLLAGQFGATNATDAFLIALFIPNLLFAILLGSGFSLGVIPDLTALRAQSPSAFASRTAGTLFGALLSGIAGALAIALLPHLWSDLFAPGFPQPTLLAHDIRLLAPIFLIYAATYGLAVVECAHDNTPAWGMVAPAQNATLVLAILLFGRRWGTSVLIGGSLAGALAALGIQLAFAFRRRHLYLQSPTNLFTNARSVLKIIGPFALALGIGGATGTSQADMFMVRLFAAHMKPGTLTLLALGNKLMGMPVMAVGMAIGVAVLPSATIAFAGPEREKVGSLARRSLLSAFAIGTPVALIYWEQIQPIISLLFHDSALTHGQRIELAHIMQWYALAVVALCCIHVLIRLLSAAKRARAVFYAGIGTIAVELLLMFLTQARYGPPGLAASISLGACIYAVCMLFVLAKHIGRGFMGSLIAPVMCVLAAVLVTHIALVFVRAHDWLPSGRIMHCAAEIAATMLVYSTLLVPLGWRILSRQTVAAAEPCN